MKNHSINKLLNVMIKLRDPNKGCPWDKKQTFESIIPHTIEEVYEVAEQVYKKDYNKIKDELGDFAFSDNFFISDSKRKKNIHF
jgi:ATP diphosphatase